MKTTEKHLEAERLLVAAAAIDFVHIDTIAVGFTSSIPAVAPPGQEYVDPYLFEIGHFKDREEYDQLSRTAKIKPRTRA